MARRPTLSQARQIEALLKAQTPLIRAAFEAAIANAHRSLDFTGLVAAIEQNDLGRVFDLLRINQAALFPLDEAIRVAFIAGGTSVIAPRGIVGGFGFNGRHPVAERIIAETGARLVSEIGSPGPEVIRTILLRGQVQGTGADRVARQLAGTINRITGIREGGILGLDGPRALRAENVRAILSDPARIAEYFKADGTPRYTSTGRNFDAMVRRAIKEGRALPSADLERVARAHEARLLKARGNAIAQNEAFTAQARGRNEAYRQMLDNPDVESITKRWQHSSLQHPRLDHMRLDQVTVNFDDAFPPMDDGAILAYPHDPAGGPQHSISCRCTVVYQPKFRKD